MAADLNNRYAVSLYVDLRLGLLAGGKMHTNEEARDKVARVYGRDAANYAERLAD